MFLTFKTSYMDVVILLFLYTAQGLPLAGALSLRLFVVGRMNIQQYNCWMAKGGWRRQGHAAVKMLPKNHDGIFSIHGNRLTLPQCGNEGQSRMGCVLVTLNVDDDDDTERTNLSVSVFVS